MSLLFELFPVNVVNKIVERRNVYIVEIRKDNEFLGYCTGWDSEGGPKCNKDLLMAKVYKSAKGSEHGLFILDKYNGGEYSFKMVECIETCATTLYDEYDVVAKKGKLKSRYFIRIKDLTDPLSEPEFLSEYKRKEKRFSSTLDIAKALYYPHSSGTYGVCQYLLKNYGGKYNFYKERFWVEEEREMSLRI